MTSNPITLNTDASIGDNRIGFCKDAIKHAFLDHPYYLQGKFQKLATRNDNHQALAYTVRDRFLHHWISAAETYTRVGSRTVAYLSAEYLLGPHLDNNLVNLGIYEEVRQAIRELGLNFRGDYWGAVNRKIVSENITKVLYPNDEQIQGKELRLEQQYFFDSCSQQDVLVDMHALDPDKISNKTNGVTPRRWIALANPRPSRLLYSAIGENWICDLQELHKLEPLTQDAVFRSEWRFVKRAVKKHFAGYLRRQTGAMIDPQSLFDGKSIVNNLLYDDPYMLLADFPSYIDCQNHVCEVYLDKEQWSRMSIFNTASNCCFSSDRSIREYCDDIWQVKPVPSTLLDKQDILTGLL